MADDLDVSAPDGHVASHDGLQRLAAAARSSFRTSEEVAASFIRNGILQGLFPPGSRLNQEQIAGALDMSRIPVRASLRHLEAERLVTLHRFRGAVVNTLSRDDIEELYELRMTVECLLLRRIVDEMTPTLAETLEGHGDALDRLVSEPDIWFPERDLFYDTLFAAARRPRMADLARALRTEVGGYVALTGAVEAHAGHRRLVQMLAAARADEAASWHREHLSRVCRRLVASLEDSLEP